MVSRRLLRIKVLKSFYSYLKSGNNSLLNAEKEVAFSIQKTYELYHYLLLLLLEVADYAQLRIDLGKQKHIPTEQEKQPNTKFIDNQLIQLLRENDALKKYCQSAKLSWIDTPELAKRMYVRISESDYFKTYMAEPTRSFGEDKQLLVNILLNEFEDCEELYDALEDKSIFWADDVEFPLSMVMKTLNQFRPNQSSSTPLLPLYKSDDDKQFPIRLLRRVVSEYDKSTPLIEQYTKNWEVERIAFMDIVILQLAIAESIEFPNIPVKVSIDEYIELSKYFSTLNSSTFINGVLDKIIQQLVTDRRIVKAGRGLAE